MERKSPLYDGKSKIIFETDHEDLAIQYFKDDATAFNAQKKGTILNKGVLNNQISSQIFRYLEKHGVHSHFVNRISDREMLVKKLKIIPVEVVVRNKAAGSICKRLGLEKGTPFKKPLVEYFFKNDSLGDPLISEGHIEYFQWATSSELNFMKNTALTVNKMLGPCFEKIGLFLVDFKLEFGRTHRGELLLADEITLDGCRLWDTVTGESMDKDRFRFDLGKVDETYREVAVRLNHYFESQL
ncbi:MAG: phosphoribosylaminoimidazolesuccinocarboxamide synthase [Proteobacteria bacterium]|nr:phosphoribosylaminoimidazolesuccinocarboxamide synthase [Pseudomonadota bacterium]NDC25002.1 phosphoribosylaminoimidazolesuccinocarboxamide synthase [Pseudomonadota bacterium]NDD05489.1 phosphoribosylaminoimidazolesuccinocarboxamide synthase [Pseudomonadota bacterium]NDG27540.1 phosphoribosylaminoimidazolesuccinocarboxamide synthase [Pseudomonadota bacterium]